MANSNDVLDDQVRNNSNGDVSSRSRSVTPKKELLDQSGDERNTAGRSESPKRRKKTIRQDMEDKYGSDYSDREVNKRKSKSKTRSKSKSPSQLRYSKKSKSRRSRSRSRHGSPPRRLNKTKSHSRRSVSRSPQRSPKISPRRSPRRTTRRSRSRSPNKKYGSPRRSRMDRSPSGNEYRRRSRTSSPEDYRLHVAELDVDVRKQEIEEYFDQFGDLKEVWMARNPPCFAFVVFKSQRSADKALRESDGMVLGHRQIKVTEARPRARGSNRGFRGSYDPNLRCYQCGEHGHFSRNCTDTKFGYKRPPTPPRNRRDLQDRSGSPRRRDDRYRDRYY